MIHIDQVNINMMYNCPPMQNMMHDNMHPQVQMTTNMNPNNTSINIKKRLISRGKIKTKNKVKKSLGVRDYMKKFQDSQTFSRINHAKVQESINNMAMYSPNKDENEPYEYKAIDSQIGSLMKRDYTVDRSQMRNQQNLASMVMTRGKPESTISPAPRVPRLNDSLMFKSTNSPNPGQGLMFNHNTISSVNAPQRNVVSPSRNIKLEPINPESVKSKLGSPTHTKLEETKSPLSKHNKITRQETEMVTNILDNNQESEKRGTVTTQGIDVSDQKNNQSRKDSVEKRYGAICLSFVLCMSFLGYLVRISHQKQMKIITLQRHQIT